jgi:quinol monooxygenase YgiN
MIVVSAMITIAEGKGDEYVAHFAKLAPMVRKDPGCLTYVLHRMIGSPDKFFVFEQYENEDAIKLHGSTPHFLAYRQATGHLVTGRDVSRWLVTV